MGATNISRAREQAREKAADAARQALLEPGEAPAAEGAKRRAGRNTAAVKEDSEKRAKALEGIPQDCVDFVRDTVGVDIAALPVSQIWDLRRGRVTGPLTVTVEPSVYDHKTRLRETAPAIRPLVSLRVRFPFKDGKITPLSAGGKVFVQTVPVIPFVLKDPAPETQSVGPVREDLGQVEVKGREFVRPPRFLDLSSVCDRNDPEKPDNPLCEIVRDADGAMEKVIVYDNVPDDKLATAPSYTAKRIKDKLMSSVEFKASSFLAFTDAQRKSLAGIGLDSNMLFAGRGSLSFTEKWALLDGRPVEFGGFVRGAGNVVVNVHGEATLDGDKASYSPVVMRRLTDGKSVPMLSSVPREELVGYTAQDFCADLAASARQGSVDFDLFRRDSENRIIGYNEAGRNLLEFGSSLAPVKGWSRDSEGKVTTASYILTMVNGSVFGEAMVEKPVIGKDGKQVTREWFDVAERKRKSRAVTAPSLPDRVINGEGQVFLEESRKHVPFASEAELDNYLKGRPAKVTGAVYHASRTGKETSYDAYVVYDPASGGARQFTPASSERIAAKVAFSESRKTHLKTSRYGIG